MLTRESVFHDTRRVPCQCSMVLGGFHVNEGASVPWY